MQITPAEAQDLLRYLQDEGRWDEPLREKLRATVREYRLDQPLPSDGVRVFGRRTYTCPFYQEGPRGCSIAPESKPFGCLAFNPTVGNEQDGSSCKSDQQSLKLVETATEKMRNQTIAEQLNLTWDKLPLPLAILEIHAATQIGSADVGNPKTLRFGESKDRRP